MANTFKRQLGRGIGTSAVKLGAFTAPVGAVDTIIGMSLANVSNMPATVDVYLNDGTNNTYLVKNAPVPVGGALILYGGDQKLVLQPGDSVFVVASVAGAIDAVMSMLEITP